MGKSLDIGHGGTIHQSVFSGKIRKYWTWGKHSPVCHFWENPINIGHRGRSLNIGHRVTIQQMYRQRLERTMIFLMCKMIVTDASYVSRNNHSIYPWTLHMQYDLALRCLWLHVESIRVIERESIIPILLMLWSMLCVVLSVSLCQSTFHPFHVNEWYFWKRSSANTGIFCFRLTS